MLRKYVTNIKAMQFNLAELSGSLGDLGTFIPLLVGMVTINGLDMSSALVFAGLFNIISGVFFGIPMAVQPMKTIAATAISEGLSVGEIVAAGIVTGGVIFVFGATGLITRLNRLIPMCLVRGLQLGIGIKLIYKGISLVASSGTVVGYDSIFTGVAAGALGMVVFFNRRVPAALLLFAGGIVLLYLEPGTYQATLKVGFHLPSLVKLHAADFLSGTLRAAIPQIPLTTLNSVIAVCALSGDLFPERKATTREVSVSVGLMNLVGCWFGAMPMCHGSGGLAGQYRFGARTGGGVIIIGVLKLAAGLLLGASLLPLFAAYPVSILGAMLVFSGIELALAARDVTAAKEYVFVLVTAGAIVALASVALGFAVGCAAYVLGMLFDRNGTEEGA